MSATLREKPKGSGKWYVVTTHRGITKARYVAEGLRAAQKIAGEVNTMILRGEFNLNPPKETKTFSEYAEKFIATCTVKPATKANYRSLLDIHVLPVLGSKKIDKINRHDVMSLLKGKLNDGLSISTVRNIRSAIENVFEMAFDDEAIPGSPIAGVKNRKLTGSAQLKHSSGVKARFLTQEESTKLLDTFMKYRPQHYPLCLLLLRTGLRIGEAVSLTWDDIDFTERKIHVRRTRSRTTIDTPKSGKSRLVDMSLQLADVMKRLRMDMLSDAVKTGTRKKWCFPGKRSGSVVDPTGWRRRNFAPIVKLAGIEKLRVHDLRHSYASQCIAAGKPILWVSQQLGHSSVTTTERIYIHIMPSAAGGADVLDDVRKVEKPVEPVWKEM